VISESSLNTGTDQRYRSSFNRPQFNPLRAANGEVGVSYYWLLLAESHLTRRLFGPMLQRIWALPVPTG
jgi:hypothetical protein